MDVEFCGDLGVDIRVTPGGLLRIDKAKMRTEANLDGKYLLRCSDPHLPAADIALG